MQFLEFLVNQSQDAITSDRRIVDNWTSIQKALKDHPGVDDTTIADDDVESHSVWKSVLDEYDESQATGFFPTYQSSRIFQTLQNPQFAHALDSVIALLSSSRSTDEISEQLVELLDYNNIDLATDILTHRATVLDELVVKPAPNVDSQKEPDQAFNYSQEQTRKRIEHTYRKNAERPLFSTTENEKAEILPHIYSTSTNQGNILSYLGSKYSLPIDTKREMYEDYEEVTIPPAKPIPPKFNEKLIPISELDPLVRGSFVGYSSLNRIQSIVYPTAYGTNENLLICAPTGAGKTDVAILTILRVIDQHRSRRPPKDVSITAALNKDAFKIIYVAPMKALVAEIVRKFEKRLRWLDIKVHELTGDMQMSKAEIAETQVIVTTPEKWDVVTRKPTGEGEIASILKLLIIDEVHLLNDERGAVIETIVARTLRQVETSQSIIRIVGLSATLPNYIDVAEFLSVSRQKGLFYFDSSFRPVPLEQHFLGIKGKPGSAISRQNFDRVVFQKVSKLVEEGHQVMVFVHARKETVKTALTIMESAAAHGNIDDFSCSDHPQWNFHRRRVGESRNKEMKRLFDSGFGIHHAGMLRADRSLTEKLFQERIIKVLCCTATLAWGVNLPAHAVIIKGTQVYGSRGTFVDLSVLDVLQIFGRAGRPGLESSGEGYICTTEDKLSHYLNSVLSQTPIESQFRNGLNDALNAEISLGTVSNVQDAIRWLGYTYLFVRMRKNPFTYGTILDDDPNLQNIRHTLATTAAQRLAGADMIVFEELTGTFRSTDLGRIAARYYIRHTSVEMYNKEFRSSMSEADVLAMMSMSTEFNQIQVRENETKELEELMMRVPYGAKGGADTNYGKVNILLQAYVSREVIDDFALVSDTAYVAQNGGRIMRALLDIALSRKWAGVSSTLLDMSKAVELRMWPLEHPLKQFSLKSEAIHGLERWAKDWSLPELAISDAQSVGHLVHLNEHHGLAIINAAKKFPSIQLQFDLRPLGPDILKISIHAYRNFVWNANIHGNSEMFLLWVEDDETSTILQLSYLVFRKSTEVIHADFIVSLPGGDTPPRLIMRSMSNHWNGAYEETPIPVEAIIMPRISECHTQKLDLPFLPLSVLGNPLIEGIFSHVSYLNSMQSQVYWSLVHSQQHSILCGPAGSGKSTVAQLALWTTVVQRPDTWVLVVVPRRSTATELLSVLRHTGRLAGVRVEYKSGPNVLSQPKGKSVYVVTAAQVFDTFHRLSSSGTVTGLDMVVCENLEQLNPGYELAISLLRHATQSSPTRFIGISNSLFDPNDLANWLGADPYAVHSFKPRDRDQSLAVKVSTISIPYSASLIKAMAKPVHNVIKEAETAIIFVPSRGHCRTVALDLLTQSALEAESTTGYLPSTISNDGLDGFIHQFENSAHYDFVTKGVGFFHDGIERKEQNFMLQLFAESILRVLVVPHEACWAIPVRAEAVVVMGCQYLQSGSEGEDRQVRDYELTEVAQMQGRAIRQFGRGSFHLFCQPEAKDTYTRFLNDGLPLESSLLKSPELEMWLRTRLENPSFSEQQAIGALSFTYLARRVESNPSYYDCTQKEGNLDRVVDTLLTRIRTSES
ncbi:hypothetical protein AX15_006384 [Amanita polypyramis BW_CC]|nr:hypothetical protein AX15_006384 [Amanita polypyramis BW_CC]